MPNATEPLNVNGLIRDARDIMLILGVTEAADVLSELKKRLSGGPDTVTVETDEYLELVESSLLLEQLLNSGVDNWTGYDHIDRAAVRAGVSAAKAKIGGAV